MIRTKYKPYPKYKSSNVEWIRETPDGWDDSVIKKIFNIQGGNGFSLEFQGLDSGDYPFLKVSSINHGEKFTNSSENYVFKPTVVSQGWRVIPKGSLLMAKIGAALKLNHRTINGVDCLIDNNTMALIIKKGFVDYYYYLFKSIDFEKFENPGAVPSINNRLLKYEFIPIPTLPEQRAIAGFLDHETARINGIVDKQTRLIEILKEKRSALITQAVTKGLSSLVSVGDSEFAKWAKPVKYKPSGMEWIGEIPEEWEVRKLKWATKIKNSNVDKKTEKNERTILLCNYVDVYKNEIIDESIDFMEASATEEEIKKFILRKNDVIITKDSEDWSDIAVPAVVKKNFENVVCGYHLALIRPDSNLVIGDYLFRALQAKSINTQFMVAANGITRFGLGISAISSSYIICPSLPEQQAIVDFLDREISKIDKLISKIEKQIELLNEYKQSLITHAVTGKIDVRGELNAENS